MAVTLGILVQLAGRSSTAYVPVGPDGRVEVRDARRAQRQVANTPDQPAGAGGAVPYVRSAAGGGNKPLVATPGLDSGLYGVRRLSAGGGVRAGGRIGQTGGAVVIS
jgi:hypothetical protein